MQAIFDHREQLSPTINTFWFRPERPVSFVAGQFTELFLPHERPDARGQRHWFTISSSPNEPLLGITTKLPLGRSSTFKQTLSTLQTGVSVKLAEPMGDFVLPKDPSIPLLFVAAGIGITPVRSMIGYLKAMHEQRPIQLIYAANRPDELIFQKLFRDYDLQFTTVVTHAPDHYAGNVGRLTTDFILQSADITDRSLIYVSGPEPMVESLTKEIIGSGVDSSQVVSDYFHGYRKF